MNFSPTVAKSDEILDHLSIRRFANFAAARNLTFGNGFASFNIPVALAKGGIDEIMIKLVAEEHYDVVFSKSRRGAKRQVWFEQRVPRHSVKEVLAARTGLRHS